MKQVVILIFAFICFSISCEKDKIQEIRKPFIIAGDSIETRYFNYGPDTIFNSKSDSFDFNYDGTFDMEFERKDVFIDCDLDSCPPGTICDCWPIVYVDYILNLAKNIEIAINPDSTIYEFSINDTISNRNIWASYNKYPMYHWSPSYCYGVSEGIIGLRNISNIDTLYSWINLKIVNYRVIIMNGAMQK
jgi:hypothetical protein